MNDFSHDPSGLNQPFKRAAGVNDFFKYFAGVIGFGFCFLFAIEGYHVDQLVGAVIGWGIGAIVGMPFYTILLSISEEVSIVKKSLATLAGLILFAVIIYYHIL
ncbi:hypothetical protein [Paraferrimonas haliotis]|uniref:Uncharacterized protein n=1 Tax=Paraferrimonas haliotis TaxID=2013866 RepID=A0AA37WZR3_9GAMM|nr:hypothetical protein [Paraferrimonas haliotis]GLS84081.1 hypothetical protein GCM10007894_20580 [Paraferrimonas haliotis]